MSAIITPNIRAATAMSFVEGFYEGNDDNICFMFAGRPNAWDNDSSPDYPLSTIAYESDTKNHIIAIKRIYSRDAINAREMALCIRRYNWEEGKVYTQYDNSVDLSNPYEWIHPGQPFYAVNSANNLYKCISNNKGAVTTSDSEPTDTTEIIFTTADGYQWKFMCNLDVDFADKFLSTHWYPIPHLYDDKTTEHLNVEDLSVGGTIDRIDITNAGDGYSSVPEVDIQGDGYGAVATAVINNNVLEDIVIVYPGTDYTWAKITIVGVGFDAEATAVISPHLGHGRDATSEMFASFVMVSTSFSTEFSQSNISYRNIGLLTNPLLYDTLLDASGTVYQYSKVLGVTNIAGVGIFSSGNTIIGETSGAEGIIVTAPAAGDGDVSVINISGTFVHGEEVSSEGTLGDINTITDEEIAIQSGNIIYNENIRPIIRHITQKENFSFIIEF